MTTLLARLLVALVLAGLSACTTSPWYPLAFAPAPVEVAAAASTVPGSQARVLVSILGVARAEEAEPDRVLVRVRLENLGTVAADVPGDELQLLSADLAPFGKARVVAPALHVDPGQDGTLDASFPFPDGRTAETIDWSGLNLRIAVDFAGARVTTGASFSRIIALYDPDPRVTFGFGVGYHGH
jgi:hypothetical protein